MNDTAAYDAFCDQIAGAPDLCIRDDSTECECSRCQAAEDDFWREQGEGDDTQGPRSYEEEDVPRPQALQGVRRRALRRALIDREAWNVAMRNLGEQKLRADRAEAELDNARQAVADFQRSTQIHMEERGKEYARGVDACIALVEQRQKHCEIYRNGDVMRTHPATFAILDEVLVFLKAIRERA